MLSIIMGEKTITLKDIITGEVKMIMPLTEQVKCLVKHIKDYETISVAGKVFDNPLTRDK